ncbi:hypothetical protein OAV01_05530 [Opitutales bacterium]|nr:hypothetical protein [Opitutales bacterium]
MKIMDTGGPWLGAAPCCSGIRPYFLEWLIACPFNIFMKLDQDWVDGRNF